MSHLLKLERLRMALPTDPIEKLKDAQKNLEALRIKFPPLYRDALFNLVMTLLHEASLAIADERRKNKAKPRSP